MRYMNQNKLFISGIEFKYSYALEGYFADVGQELGMHQIQIQTEDGGTHWEAQLVLHETPYETHDPTSAGADLIKALKELKL